MLEPEAEFGLTLGLAALVLDSEYVDIAPAMAVPLALTSDCDVLPYLTFDLDIRIAPSEVFAILLGDQLVIVGLGDLEGAVVGFNVGFAVQPMPEFGFRIGTRLLLVDDDGNTLGPSDLLPLTMSLLGSASPNVDLFGSLGFFDLENAGDFYVITLGALIRPS